MLKKKITAVLLGLMAVLVFAAPTMSTNYFVTPGGSSETGFIGLAGESVSGFSSSEGGNVGWGGIYTYLGLGVTGPTVTTTGLPPGTVGASYTAQLSAAGGMPPYTWSNETPGPQPAWLGLNAVTGLLSGTPTASGTLTLVFRVTDSAGNYDDSAPLPLTINPSIFPPTGSITGEVRAYDDNTPIAGAVVSVEGTMITSRFAITDAAGNYAFHGLPPANNYYVSASAGGYAFASTSEITVAASASTEVNFNLFRKLIIVTTALPNAVQNRPYAAAVAATGGVTPYRWSVYGISNTGLITREVNNQLLISGEPTAGGQINLTVTVTDSSGTAVIIPPPPPPPSPPPGGDSRPMTALDKPAVGPYTDPVFNTSMRRLTDNIALASSIPLTPTGMFPDYSKRQAWNADESRLLLRTGNGEALLFDGNSYAFIRNLPLVGGDDIFWHPTDPAVMYLVLWNNFYRYDLNTDTRTLLRTFNEYNQYVQTPGEGNLSRDGRYLALRGVDAAYSELFVYDIVNNAVLNRLRIPAGAGGFDWVSISPGGNYVVVDWADEVDAPFHGVEVFNRDFTSRWHAPMGTGHSDIGYDADGSEVIVKMIYEPAREVNPQVIYKYRLSDGVRTELLNLPYYFDTHLSLRNYDRPGWCIVGTFDDVSRTSDLAAAPEGQDAWYPFEDEVFALNLNGSGRAERYAHHRSRRFFPGYLVPPDDTDTSNYFAEPHATVSRGGNRIIYGSNWRLNMNRQDSVDAYLIDLR